MQYFIFVYICLNLQLGSTPHSKMPPNNLLQTTRVIIDIWSQQIDRSKNSIHPVLGSG